jgi:pyruvate dehydrogenase phosphatase
VHAFRTARRVPTWKVVGRKVTPSYFSASHAFGLRSSSTGRNAAFVPAPLQSSMHLRTFSLVLVSTLVASGAWFAYKGSSTRQSRDLSNKNGTGISDSFPSAHASENTDELQPTNRALLIENDQFYVTTLSSDPPLAKQTDDSDRRVLGMLTPEQATHKLRRNEESYLVNRGQGVVRYDIVQIPSNSPIEDDHAEKIVEVPQCAIGAQERPLNNDWMFWGVFDGHS